MTGGRELATSGKLELEGDFLEVHCGRCHGELCFHQPDEELPHRILATCGVCGSWYLIDLVNAWIVMLPRFERSRTL